MSTLAAHGISVEVPKGWEARFFVPNVPPPAINLPVLHLTDAILTSMRSSFAPELAARAGGSGVLVALLEFDHAMADKGLYAPQGLDLPIGRERFNPRALQMPNPLQEGHQRFFSSHGRAFCLYVVLGTARGAEHRLHTVNEALRSLRIEPRGTAA